MPISPTSCVLVQVEKNLNDELELANGLKLFFSGEWNWNNNVTCSGKVTHVPHGTTHIQPDDEVCFSFQVIADRTFTSNKSVFFPVSDGKFMNSKGDTIIVYRYKKNSGFDEWTACCLDAKGNPVDGVQNAKEKDVQKFLSQFAFVNSDEYKLNNLVVIDGKEYWKVEVEDVFAKKVGDEIIPLSNRVICEIIEEDVKHRIEIMEGKILPYQDVKLRHKDRAKVLCGGEKLGLEKGDVIGFKFSEMYELWGKNYYLVKEKRVLGKWSNN
jgi:hypothetical protein